MTKKNNIRLFKPNYNDSFNYNSSSISVPFDVTMTTTMSIEGKENEIFYDGLSDLSLIHI